MQYRVYQILSGALFALLMSASPLSAQEQPEERYSFEFRGETLEDALDQVVKTTHIDLVYDPQLVRGIHVYKRVENLPAPQVLGKVLDGTCLDFVTLSSGTVVIVKAVRDAPARGSFAGRVVDRRTGEPLPGASVMLVDASGGTSTDRAGRFNLNGLVSGSYNIVFSYVGYEPVYMEVEIEPDRQLREDVQLEAKPVSIAPVVVTGHIPQMPRQNSSSQSIRPGSEWEPAGGVRDAIRSLNLFSGIQYGLPLTDLHIQGSRHGEHRMLLDGVPVYNPYSFGRMFSAFSPYAIGNVHLHKAGYGVQEGSQIAGLVDFRHELPGSDTYGLMLQGDPLSLNSRAELGTRSGGDSSLKLMAAGRTNYWDIYRDPTLEQTLGEWDEVDPLITNMMLNPENSPWSYQTLEHDSDVRFYDVHLASSYEIDTYNSLSGSLYAGRNFVKTDLLAQAVPSVDDDDYMYARDQYEWNNLMGQLTHTWAASPRLDLATQASYSANRLDHRYILGISMEPGIPSGRFLATTGLVFEGFQSAGVDNRLPTQTSGNRIEHLILRSDATYSFTPRFNLDAGIQLDRVSSQLDLSDLFFLNTQSDRQSAFLSTYLSGNWQAGEYWKLNLGSRLTSVRPSGRLYAESRASVQYDRPGSGIGYWSARLSGGLYRQFINQFEITNAGPTALVPSFTVWSHTEASELPVAYHLSGSFLFESGDHTSVTLEVFRKWQPTTYITSYSNLLTGYSLNRTGFDAFGETTSMATYGSGVRIHQAFPRAQLQLMFGYDYSISRLDMQSRFGRTLQAPWSEPHRLQLRTLWRARPDLTAVVKWQSVLGRTWGFRQAYYDYLPFKNSGFSFTNPEEDRLSPFRQLDVSIIYKPGIGFSDLELRLDLVNVLNRSNVIDWSLLPEESGEEFSVRERTMPGFTPSLSVQLDF